MVASASVNMIKDQPVSSLDDLPEYTDVYSLPDGLVSLPSELKRVYAIVGTGGGNCTILLTESSKKDLQTRDVQVRCGHAGLSVSNKIVCAPDLIGRVNSHIKKVVQETKNASEAVKGFDLLLRRGVASGASDIHVVRTEDYAEIFMRIHGDKQKVDQWDTVKSDEVLQAAYNSLADQDSKSHGTWLMGLAQDAVIEREIDGGKYRIRYAHSPIFPRGFHCAMRILPVGKNFDQRTMADLGYSPRQTDQVDIMMDSPTGVIIIAGETGSGKSTTIVTLLNEMILREKNKINVITLEDPPEYEITNAIQVPISKYRSKESEAVKVNPFSQAIRSAMRRDPDVIMVAEVRDSETAEGLAQAVLSGHKSMTTIHANSGIDIISRLSQLMRAATSLGDPSEILGSPGFLTGLIYQRLLPSLCPSCKIPSDEAIEMGLVNKKLQDRVSGAILDYPESTVFYNNNDGCSDSGCIGGISGRSVTAEVVIPDLEMVGLFREGRQAKALEYWLKNGGKSIVHHGIEKMRAGIVSPIDLERKLKRIPDEKGSV